LTEAVAGAVPSRALIQHIGEARLEQRPHGAQRTAARFASDDELRVLRERGAHLREELGVGHHRAAAEHGERDVDRAGGATLGKFFFGANIQVGVSAREMLGGFLRGNPLGGPTRGRGGLGGFLHVAVFIAFSQKKDSSLQTQQQTL